MLFDSFRQFVQGFSTQKSGFFSHIFPEIFSPPLSGGARSSSFTTRTWVDGRSSCARCFWTRWMAGDGSLNFPWKELDHGKIYRKPVRSVVWTCLVAINFIFPLILGFCHHPNWRSHIFQRGGKTTNQPMETIGNHWSYCKKDDGKNTMVFYRFPCRFFPAKKPPIHWNMDWDHCWKTINSSTMKWTWVSF